MKPLSLNMEKDWEFFKQCKNIARHFKKKIFGDSYVYGLVMKITTYHWGIFFQNWFNFNKGSDQLTPCEQNRHQNKFPEKYPTLLFTWNFDL